MLVSPVFPASASVQPGGARDPTGRAPAAQAAPSVAASAATPECATRAVSDRAVAQVSPGRAAVMASLRARLALPLAERPQPGPPPSFQTSLIEDLRRELQTPPLERARAAPEPLPNSDRPAPQAREDSAPAVDVPPLGAGGPDRADPPGPFGTGPAGAIMQADAAAPGTRASIDLHL